MLDCGAPSAIALRPASRSAVERHQPERWTGRRSIDGRGKGCSAIANPDLFSVVTSPAGGKGGKIFGIVLLIVSEEAAPGSPPWPELRGAGNSDIGQLAWGEASGGPPGSTAGRAVITS